MTKKDVQIKVIDFNGQTKDWIGDIKKAKEMFEMFVANCNSFSDFKIKTALMIDIQSGRVIEKFNQ